LLQALNMSLAMQEVEDALCQYRQELKIDDVMHQVLFPLVH